MGHFSEISSSKMSFFFLVSFCGASSAVPVEGNDEGRRRRKRKEEKERRTRRKKKNQKKKKNKKEKNQKNKKNKKKKKKKKKKNKVKLLFPAVKEFAQSWTS